MRLIRDLREKKGISQRNFASRAGLSFGALQRLEQGKTDARVSTLESALSALGFSPPGLAALLESHLRAGENSVAETSLRVALAGEDSWPLWLFNFVDAYRRDKAPQLVSLPPVGDCPARVRALFASTVEFLCAENSPDWCRAVRPLPRPWFPAGIENLKATALVESPAVFRKRGIFVLGNFLDRA